MHFGELVINVYLHEKLVHGFLALWIVAINFIRLNNSGDKILKCYNKGET